MKQIIKKGRGSINQLNQYIGPRKKNILVVCGKSLVDNHNAIKVIKKLKKVIIYFSLIILRKIQN